MWAESSGIGEGGLLALEGVEACEDPELLGVSNAVGVRHAVGEEKCVRVNRLPGRILRPEAAHQCSSLFFGMSLAPAPSPVSRVQRTKPCPFAAYPKR